MAWQGYTQEQWADLTATAPQIAMAIAAASGSAAQTGVELEAFLDMVHQTADQNDRSSLLGRLAADTAGRIAGRVEQAGEDVIASGIHAARRAGALLAVHPDEREARAARIWLLEVARTVAGAAREGGILGIGATAISHAERETMAAIEAALG